MRTTHESTFLSHRKESEPHYSPMRATAFDEQYDHAGTNQPQEYARAAAYQQGNDLAGGHQQEACRINAYQERGQFTMQSSLNNNYNSVHEAMAMPVTQNAYVTPIASLRNPSAHNNENKHPNDIAGNDRVINKGAHASRKRLFLSRMPAPGLSGTGTNTHEPLTPNSIQAMFNMDGSAENPTFTPTVQVIHLKKIDNNAGGGDERWKVILSDGAHYLSGVCATHLNSLVNSGIISQLCILKVNEFVISTMGSGQKICILLAAEQVGLNPGARMGSPEDIAKVPIQC